ncbi:hypothetical protein D6817_04475 [Candidatus Pacearchaeota archaeon]|nr:MAG: hypothetical protein D6817_04475 [Candidatus Pacearchaeota archaeon]
MNFLNIQCTKEFFKRDIHINFFDKIKTICAVGTAKLQFISESTKIGTNICDLTKPALADLGGARCNRAEPLNCC